MTNDVADELGAVHAFGEFGLDVVPLPGVNALKVRRARRVDLGRHQEAELDQLIDLGRSIIVLKVPPRPRPSRRHGVAVSPISVASG